MIGLEGIFGNRTAALVLLALARRRQVYATGLAKGLSIPLNMVQKQLVRLEKGGVVKSFARGRKKMYRWDEGFPFRYSLERFLAQVEARGSRDAADGRFLTYEERLALSESLWREAMRLCPKEVARPYRFAKCFDSFASYEKWKKEKKVA